jgi:hypothetical protein
MITALNFLFLQAATVALPAPDALQSYDWCVYRMAEARADQPIDQAVREALIGCDNGPLLDSAVAQVIGVASGSPAARNAVANLLRHQARVNAVARLNLIRSYEKADHAPH